MHDVAEFCCLPPEIERGVLGKMVQQGSHPPREALGIPNATQANLGIAIEQASVARGIETGERFGKNPQIGCGEVQPLGTRRRNDVRSVSREEKLAVLHRLDYEAPHSCYASLDDCSFLKGPSVAAYQTCP